jgi:hypothetical protein
MICSSENLKRFICPSFLQDRTLITVGGKSGGHVTSGQARDDDDETNVDSTTLELSCFSGIKPLPFRRGDKNGSTQIGLERFDRQTSQIIASFIDSARAFSAHGESGHN